jgi:hypothetical protein
MGGHGYQQHYYNNDAANGTNADKIAQAKQYKGQIADLKGQIEALGKFDPTNPKQVEAAQKAVTEASWQTHTCGRNCDMDAKTSALADAQSHLDELSARQAKMEEAGRLKDTLKEAQDKLVALGYVPEHANKTAAQVADYLSYFGATADGVEKWQPLVRSLIIEMINRLAPGFVFLFILGLFSDERTKSEEPEAAPEMEDKPGNVRPVSISEDPTSPPSRRTVKERTPKSKEDVSGNVVRFPKAEDARALIEAGMTQVQAAEALGVSDRTIRRWLSSLDADSCPGVSGQDAVRDAA